MSKNQAKPYSKVYEGMDFENTITFAAACIGSIVFH